MIKEFAFGLLHAPCGIGVADGGGLGLERDEAETGAKVLCRFGEAEQGFQWSLITTVDAAHAPFVGPLGYQVVHKDDESSDTD